MQDRVTVRRLDASDGPAAVTVVNVAAKRYCEFLQDDMLTLQFAQSVTHPRQDRQFHDRPVTQRYPLLVTIGINDTDPVASAEWLARLRLLSIEQRVGIISSLNRDVEDLALAGISQRHPQASPEEKRLRLGALRLGPQIMREVFGWDVTVEGY